MFSRQQGAAEFPLTDWCMQCHLLNSPTLQTYGSIIVPLAETEKKAKEGQNGGRIKIQRTIIEDEKEAGKVERVGRVRETMS